MYPHEFSGGMRQRVMIAMALLCRPQRLIADEPTTALDVTVQAQIMTLMNELKREFNTAIIMITHDLGVVAGICNKVLVMYAGRTMEYGKVDDIFYRPSHPYTEGLLRAIPGSIPKGKICPPFRVTRPTCCVCRPAAPSRSVATGSARFAASSRRSSLRSTTAASVPATGYLMPSTPGR